ncbi:MAG TPA: apolipoprotein N-acyltransferase, partial [Silvibacterium sp.]|nr:apolipoprotein N-acyltransferase [Silvibacterium sp.]
ILSEDQFASRSYLWRSAFGGYVCGVAWYLVNCYWIYATMHIYGGIGPIASCGILLLYSLVLGLYFGVFGLLIALTRQVSRSPAKALLLAPIYWVALEFAASRITCVPWDQLGYSQVDNFLLTRLAPVTGVYGISFVLMAGNAMFAAALLTCPFSRRLRFGFGALLFAGGLQLGLFLTPPPAPVEATAVLLQQNLDVNQSNDWDGPEWDRHTAEFVALSLKTCGPYFAGMPEPHPKLVVPECPVPPRKPDLVAWPESPSPFREADPRFQRLMSELTREADSPAVVGNIGTWYHDGGLQIFNSAEFVAPDGRFLGRYDKIHLVPFGEYVPYKGLIAFAGTLTQGVGNFSRGGLRKVFTAKGHTFGVFVCYEAVFADEVRHFAKNGAQVLVNISDDGWYGDTSAPWQHFNMARMRAIENHRWLLRATNSGVTAAVDPFGRVTQSAPRHVMTSLAVHYGYRSDITFYTRYGDVFAKLCAIIAIAAVAQTLRLLNRRGMKSS